MPTVQSGMTVSPPLLSDPPDEPRAKEALNNSMLIRVASAITGNLRYLPKTVIEKTSIEEFLRNWFK
jgi:hypothetical protein